jgi:hypothetical protein
MALHVYDSVRASSSVPADWEPFPQGTIKYPVRNAAVLRHLRSLKAGRWKKVLKSGSTGEVHYFEHESGAVAGVKFIAPQPPDDQP